jgi:hypothetical protein
MFKFVKNILSKRKGLGVYEAKLIEFLSDNKLDEKEKKELEELASQYGLTGEELIKIKEKGVSNVFSNIGKDQRISEEERGMFSELLNYFGVDKSKTEFNQNTFNKYYSLALIDKGILPVVENHDINITFKQNEVLHWACGADLRKIKKITTRLNYGGLSFSIKIMKGMRYRVGSMSVNPQVSEQLVTEDNGTFWFTNMRIGFKGIRKNFDFPYSKINFFELMDGGLVISKSGKETPYVVSLKDYDVPCSILSHILNK